MTGKSKKNVQYSTNIHTLTTDSNVWTGEFYVISGNFSLLPCAFFFVMLSSCAPSSFFREKKSLYRPLHSANRSPHTTPTPTPHTHPTSTLTPHVSSDNHSHTHTHALCCLVTITKVRKIPDQVQTVLSRTEESFLHVDRRGESDLSKTNKTSAPSLQ